MQALARDPVGRAHGPVPLRRRARVARRRGRPRRGRRARERSSRSGGGCGGFGYDPIFVPAGWDETMAELTDEQKDRISHRGRAFRALAATWPTVGRLEHAATCGIRTYPTQGSRPGVPTSSSREPRDDRESRARPRGCARRAGSSTASPDVARDRDGPGVHRGGGVLDYLTGPDVSLAPALPDADRARDLEPRSSLGGDLGRGGLDRRRSSPTCWRTVARHERSDPVLERARSGSRSSSRSRCCSTR